MIKSSRSKRRKLNEELQFNDCFIYNDINNSNNVRLKTSEFINNVEHLSNNCEINSSNNVQSTTAEFTNVVEDLGNCNTCPNSVNTDHNTCTSDDITIPQFPKPLISTNKSASANISIPNSISDDDNDNTLCNTTIIMQQRISEWSADFNVNQTTLNGLLKVLRSDPFNLINLPKDSRTVMSTLTTQTALQVYSVEPGEYYHFGLGTGIQLHFTHSSSNNETDTIEIVIGIDGLPLTKSSNSQFWPILGYIRPYNNFVFLIGLYWGNKKPQDSNLYLEKFVLEAKELLESGITINNIHKSITINAFCLDAPARSYVLKTKGHTGYHSCSRCLHEGEYLNNRSCFPYVPNGSITRTHNDYLTRKHDEHHTSDLVSILIDLPNIDIVKSFVLDYMHLTCLGVTKKMILLWIDNGPLKVRIPSSKTKILSTSLLLLAPCLTSEFSRKPRGINEIHRWKATELRQFLLYTGPIVLKTILNEDCYKHFMSFNIAMLILLSPDKGDFIEYAEQLLNHFVQYFGTIYEPYLISYNVHGLLHLVDDYKNFGPLDNISCFPFENFMKYLKKKVRKQEKPLQQVVKRYHEEAVNKQIKKIYIEINLKHQHSNGPLLNDLTDPQYRTIYLKRFVIKTKRASDSYILTKEDNVVQVNNIATERNTNYTVLIGKMFKVKKPFFNQPIDSSMFHIYIVSELDDIYKFWYLKDVKKKIILFKHKNNNIAMPVIHSNEL